jgi:hypothetical protein
MRGRLSMAVGRSTFGAERRHVTLPTDFRSRSENGLSRYGHLTARFAPKPTSASTLANDEVGTIPVVRVVAIPAGRALGTKFEKCSASKIVVPDRETP